MLIGSGVGASPDVHTNSWSSILRPRCSPPVRGPSPPSPLARICTAHPVAGTYKLASSCIAAYMPGGGSSPLLASKASKHSQPPYTAREIRVLLARRQRQHQTQESAHVSLPPIPPRRIQSCFFRIPGYLDQPPPLKPAGRPCEMGFSSGWLFRGEMLARKMTESSRGRGRRRKK